MELETTRQEAYAIGRYGSKQLVVDRANGNNQTYEDFVATFYGNRPQYQYASYLMCSCGSSFKQEGTQCVCTRKTCYRNKHPLDTKVAKIMFLQGDDTTTQTDVQAGNKAIFNKGGVVKVLRRDNKNLQ